MKIKIHRKQLKTVAKYLYRPEFHGQWSDLMMALENTFDITEESIPARRNRLQAERKKAKAELPPPIPLEAIPDSGKRLDEYRSRNYSGYKVTVHRGTPKIRTLCGSMGLDVVTSLEDKFVNCENCLLPKNQRKITEYRGSVEHFNDIANGRD